MGNANAVQWHGLQPVRFFKATKIQTAQTEACATKTSILMITAN
jgi:hypothetical protein